MSRHGIGQRIFRQTLLLGLAFALAAALLQFVFEYRLKMAATENVLDSISQAVDDGLSAAIWNADHVQLQLSAQGILNFQYINRVRISDSDGVLADLGISGNWNEDPVRRVILTHRQKDWLTPVGRLELTIDSGRILTDVMAQVLIAVLFQVALLSLASLTVYQLFKQQATGYLIRIADYLEEFHTAVGGAPLRLDKVEQGDEIDVLVRSFNDMRERLLATMTAQSETLDRLHASEARYRGLIDQAPDAILVLDAGTGRFVDANNSAVRMFASPREVLLEMDWSQLFPAEVDGLAIPFGDGRSTEPSLVQRRIRSADGQELTCELRLTRLDEPGRSLVRASCLDITARILAEERVHVSLHEKEILLQEVYHRTKNNMQVIAALLEMKAMRLAEGPATQVLAEMVQRIRVMALVHQKLYQSNDLSRIGLKGYLDDLLGLLGECLGTREHHIAIRLEVLDNPDLLIDTVIPVGLVINELVTNACKYAFEGRPDALIRISIRRSGPGMMELTVSDNGKGLPPDFDLTKQAGMGLQTVRAQIEQQLQGSVRVSTGEGTTWSIEFLDGLYQTRI